MGYGAWNKSGGAEAWTLRTYDPEIWSSVKLVGNPQSPNFRKFHYQKFDAAGITKDGYADTRDAAMNAVA